MQLLQRPKSALASRAVRPATALRPAAAVNTQLPPPTPENSSDSRPGSRMIATQYQATTSRATPEGIEADLRRLQPPSGPTECRHALYSLSLALANVQPFNECAVVD